MSDEEKPKTGPDYISTKTFPKVEVPENTLDAVLSEVKAMRAETNDKFVEASTRMDRWETRLFIVENRLNNNSGGVRQLSSSNSNNEAAIATIITKVTGIEGKVTGLEGTQAGQTSRLDSIEKKTDTQTQILTDLRDGTKALLKNPKFLALVAATYTAAMYWLGSHQGH